MEQTLIIDTTNYLEKIAEHLSKIDTETADKWTYDENPIVKVVEQQKVYFWIRLYLKEEAPNIKIGSDITIKYQPLPIYLNDIYVNQDDVEELTCKFICYDKVGVAGQQGENITNYNSEDDKRVLCLMVDSSQVNGNEKIPFIRTLFKASRHYDYQLIRRSELLFIDSESGDSIDYYDCSF